MIMAKDNEQDEVKKTINIIDHRRFDSEGRDRVDLKAETSLTESVKAASEIPGLEAETPNSEDSANEMAGVSISFSSFTVSLANQALLHMGVINAPPGVDVPVDKDAARQTIDILQMLESKTRGNLEPVEERLLREVLHELRLNFVRMSLTPTDI